MSKIDKMIADLCPDGVEYKRLGDIGSFTRGSGIQKKDFVDEGMPCIHYGQIYTRFGLFTDHALAYIPESQYKKCKKANPSDVIFTITSENIEDVCTPLVWEGKQPAAISGHSCAFTSSEINPRFLAYIATGLPFQKAKARAAKGTKVIEVAPGDLARVEIPVPPMEIQQEIVRILDSFAKLEAELEAELEARKTQYAFYRDKLLSVANLEKMDGKSVEMKRLDNCGTFERGKRFTKDDYRDSGIPCIHYAEIYTEYQLATSETVSFVRSDIADSLRFANCGDLIIACTGETKEDIAKAVVWEGDERVAVHDDCHILHTAADMNPRYLNYCFQTDNFSKAKMAFATKGKTVRIAASRLASIEIPVPSLETQQRIVDILDRFNSLTTSLTNGLPAEIAARRQQYEHYRDRLLDLPRKGPEKVA